MDIKAIVEHYCSFPVASPLVFKHYNDVTNYLNSCLYKGELDKETYVEYESKVNAMLGQAPKTSTTSIIQKYRSKYFNYKEIEYFLEGLEIKDVLIASSLANEVCYFISQGFLTGKFSENNKYSLAILGHLAQQIKLTRATKNEIYWRSISNMKILLPAMIKNGYTNRLDAKPYINLLSALLLEERDIKDDFPNLFVNKLQSFDSVSNDINIDEFIRRLGLDLTIKYIQDETSFRILLSEEAEKKHEEFSFYERDKITATLNTYRDNFLKSPRNNFAMGVYYDYFSLKSVGEKYPWMRLYLYPDYILSTTYKVLDSFRRDFTKEGVLKVVIDMYIVNAKTLEGYLDKDDIKEVTLNSFKESLRDMVRSNIISLDAENDMLETFSKVYDHYYGGNKNDKR